MKLTQKGNRYYVVKRVPQRFRTIEPRRQVWITLGTDSLREARQRAVEAVRDLENQWIAALSSPGATIQRYKALSEVAFARGFAYVPAAQVAQLSMDELLLRITAAQESPTVEQAVLGHEKKPKHRLSEIVALYMQLVAVEVKDKGRDQRRMWQNALKRSVGRLIKAVGDKPVEDLGREDALAFRKFWATRIQEEGVSPSTANREFATLSGLFSTLYKC